MSATTAISGAAILDGDTHHRNRTLLIDEGGVLDIVRDDGARKSDRQVNLDGGTIVPGFIDLQVNGGGGVLLNEQPDADGIATICKAHAQFGTTALLPTLISDSPQVTERAIEAATLAGQRKIPGFLGLHLEGPHLAAARKGAHAAAHIRPMGDDDLDTLISVKGALDKLLVTVAPESVSTSQIKRLADAGIVVSLGHTDAGFDQAKQCADAGARAVTHLFNAMSGLGHREPGLVGAALNCGNLFAGLIADGFHVDTQAISIALKAKTGPGKIFLVTDAMPTIGTGAASFTLNGRTVNRSGGKLTLEDGTLAGADLDMISAVRFLAEKVGAGFDEAVRMASLYPAECMGIDDRHGHLKPGAVASFVHLGPGRDVRRVWIDGQPVWPEAGI